MDKEKAIIRWEYSGKTDSMLGTGATRSEAILTWGTSALVIAVYLFLYLRETYAWEWWQWIIGVLIAMDIGSGMVANSLNSGKRYYHTPYKPGEEPGYVRYLKNHYIFCALHIYPLLVGWLIGDGDWLYGLFWYGYLLASVAAVLAVPLYLRRPAAMVVVLVALLANGYLIEPVAGFEWLAVALILKIVVGHIVREEPYRPLREGA